jgi:hypothetical protein
VFKRFGGRLRPVFDTLIGDPVRQGRLRLDGLSPTVRQMSAVGLVTLAGLLGSLVLNDLWRRGDLLHLTVSSGRFTFIPVALFPATIVALFVGWALILWGAAQASTPVRIVAGLMFLLVNAPVGRVSLVELSTSEPIAPLLVRIGYFAAPAALLVLSLVQVRSPWRDRARPLAQGIILAALVCMFGGVLWSNVLQIRNGIPQTLPFALSNAIRNAQDLLIPLVIISSIAVIEFSRGVAAAAASPLWTSAARVAKAVSLALIGLKLWIQLGRHWGDWATYVVHQPASVVASLLVVGFLAGGAWFARRHAPNPGAAEASKERLIYGPAFVLALPAILLLLLKTSGDFMLTQVHSLEAARLIGQLPLAEYLSDVDVAVAVALLLVGVALYARRDGGPLYQEAGIGLLLVGTWASVLFILELLGVTIGWRAPFLDVLITAGIGGYLVARWRRIDAAGAVTLGAVVLFLWLMMTKGDFISILGGLAGLPAVVVVAVGTIFALVADSSFAAGHSRWFPRSSRPLLWIGYLVVSMTIVHWLATAHGADVTEAVGSRGWTYLGVPLAVWLLARMPFAPPKPEPRARAAEFSGDEPGTESGAP